MNKKCISCQKEIEDTMEFCPHCGAKQDGKNLEPAKKTFPITERAFCRIFRASFFGGLSQIDIDTLCTFIATFLSLSRALTDNEISEINRGFDTLLNNAKEEYNLRNERPHYVISAVNIQNFEDEKFRFQFLGDNILHTLEVYRTRGGLGSNLCRAVWLFALLAALDGNYSDDKLMFFRRIKNQFSVTGEQFKKFIYNSIEQDITLKDKDDDSSISETFEFLFKNKNWKNFVWEKLASKVNVVYEDENGTEVNTSLRELMEQLPEDFDFYNIVEEKTKSLCELEYQIQELENSEGKYAEIADKIAELARQERALLATLPGFYYWKF